MGRSKPVFSSPMFPLVPSLLLHAEEREGACACESRPITASHAEEMVAILHFYSGERQTNATSTSRGPQVKLSIQKSAHKDNEPIQSSLHGGYSIVRSLFFSLFCVQRQALKTNEDKLHTLSAINSKELHSRATMPNI